MEQTSHAPDYDFEIPDEFEYDFDVARIVARPLPDFTYPSRLRERPADRPPSPVDVLEAFFGSLDETTPDLIRTMPVDQAHVLMEQLTYYVNASLTALINRSQRHKRQLPVAEGYEFLERDELDTHEALFLRTPQDPEMASVANLKHLLLYCERVVAWNPTAIHQYDLLPPEQWIPRLADGVAQLVPIADLVRDGRIVLAQTRFLALSENVPQLIAHPDVCLSDPYAAYLLAQAARRSPELRDLIETACAGHYEIHDSKGIYRATPAVTDALLKRYPHRMNALALRRLIVYARDLREFRLDPITADPILKHHLEQGTSLLLDGRPLPPRPRVSPASYAIPSLHDLTLRDVVALRNDEAVFSDLHQALEALTRHCAEADLPDSAEAYRAHLREYAADTVRGHFEALQRLQRKAQARSILAKLTYKGLALEVTGFMSLVAECLEPLVGRKADLRAKNAKVAGMVLKSIAGPGLGGEDNQPGP